MGLNLHIEPLLKMEFLGSPPANWVYGTLAPVPTAIALRLLLRFLAACRPLPTLKRHGLGRRITGNDCNKYLIVRS